MAVHGLQQALTSVLLQPIGHLSSHPQLRTFMLLTANQTFMVCKGAVTLEMAASKTELLRNRIGQPGYPRQRWVVIAKAVLG